MKKVVVLVLALILIVGAMFAQGTKPLKKIILSNAYYTAPYCAAFNPAAIAKAKELGYELQILDGEGNQQRQLEHARIAISNAAGFIYFPADVAGSIPIVEALNKSKLAVRNCEQLYARRAESEQCTLLCRNQCQAAWTQHGDTSQTASPKWRECCGYRRNGWPCADHRI